MFRTTAVMLIFAILITLLSGACGSGKTKYEIDVDGIAEQTGVIYFLDYSINVYADQAGNPCGDCADQPVHLFVGDNSAAVVQAISELITRADDRWEVSSATENNIILSLRNGETAGVTDKLAAPAGISLTGILTVNGKSETTLSELSDTSIIYKPLMPDSQPERIAAVYGPSYEMLVVLGVEDSIVVRADVQTDSFPWAEEVFSRITQVPELDNVHSSVNFEQLMTYNPDIVFTFPRQNELKQLSDANITAVEGKTYDYVEGVCEFLTIYARSLGESAVEKSEKYCEYFNEKLDEIRAITETIPEDQRKSVYYAGTDVLTTYGKQSDVVDIIETAGGIAVSAELNGGNRVQINYEKLMTWNPDCIFLDHGGMNDGKSVEDIKSELLTDRQYAPITAVRDNQIFTVPSGVFYWDMGLQKILLVEFMAKTLYPEYFEDLDMTKELTEFYSMFYGYELTEVQAEQILNRQNP